MLEVQAIAAGEQGDEASKKPRTYVDDLKLSAAGAPDRSSASLRDRTLRLKSALEDDGMVLEMDKCKALGTTKAHREALRRAFSGTGVKVVDTARDLGTDAALGSRRRVMVLKPRLKAGRSRLSKLARAPLDRRRRAVHAKTLGASVATYGVEVMGMAPHHA